MYFLICEDIEMAFLENTGAFCSGKGAGRRRRFTAAVVLLLVCVFAVGAVSADTGTVSDQARLQTPSFWDAGTLTEPTLTEPTLTEPTLTESEGLSTPSFRDEETYVCEECGQPNRLEIPELWSSDQTGTGDAHQLKKQSLIVVDQSGMQAALRSNDGVFSSDMQHQSTPKLWISDTYFCEECGEPIQLETPRLFVSAQ